LTFPKTNREKKFKPESNTGISSLSKATAKPIAPVFQMLAADAVPATLSLSLKMAPPTMNPIPVMIP